MSGSTPATEADTSRNARRVIVRPRHLGAEAIWLANATRDVSLRGHELVEALSEAKGTEAISISWGEIRGPSFWFSLVLLSADVV